MIRSVVAASIVTLVCLGLSPAPTATADEQEFVNILYANGVSYPSSAGVSVTDMGKQICQIGRSAGVTDAAGERWASLLEQNGITSREEWEIFVVAAATAICPDILPGYTPTPVPPTLDELRRQMCVEQNYRFDVC